MAVIVGIVSMHGLKNEVRHTNQPNKSKLALYKHLLHFYSHLKQLCMSNKTECFGYNGGCGMQVGTCIEVIKRRSGLGYR